MNIKKNIKSMVVDVDGTLCTAVNRDYANAIPNKELINNLNRLYDAGWEIIVFTARGQLSCDGDLDLILEKNEQILRNWLDNNGVKYTDLIFGKPFANHGYYIDDKALRPDEVTDQLIDNLLLLKNSNE